MAQIGRKIFYDLTTGSVIADTGERQGNISSTTVEQDIAVFTALSERNRDTFDVIELPFGKYAQDFIEAESKRVNPLTKEIEFAYPDPAAPVAEPTYQKPLTAQVDDLKEENATLKQELGAISDALFQVMFSA